MTTILYVVIDFFSVYILYLRVIGFFIHSLLPEKLRARRNWYILFILFRSETAKPALIFLILI